MRSQTAEDQNDVQAYVNSLPVRALEINSPEWLECAET